jgi:excisionase family DNA binding protein
MRLPVDTRAACSLKRGPGESGNIGSSSREFSARAARTELIGIGALAAWLGVEIAFVRRLVAERRIPFLKIGKFVRFDPDEVATWLDQQRVGVYEKRAARHGGL